MPRYGTARRSGHEVKPAERTISGWCSAIGAVGVAERHDGLPDDLFDGVAAVHDLAAGLLVGEGREPGMGQGVGTDLGAGGQLPHRGFGQPLSGPAISRHSGAT